VTIIVDTNVLVRAAVRDDEMQAAVAIRLLTSSPAVVVTTVTWCEFVWVLRRSYGFGMADICLAIRALLGAENVVTDRAAAEAGLAMLEAGADFADGVMAHEGRWLGGETFVSFDRAAIRQLLDGGYAATLLTADPRP
jgi:predicted nucleic-acid-binding protein